MRLLRKQKKYTLELTQSEYAVLVSHLVTSIKYDNEHVRRNMRYELVPKYDSAVQTLMKKVQDAD